MHQLHLAYAVVGVTSVLLALVSRRIRHLPLTEPLVALVLGVVVGPQVLALVHVGDHTRDLLLLEGSRLLLALSVMAAAMRFQARDLRPLLRAVVVLLVLVMPLAALAAGASALLLGMPVALAMLLGACLSPTDPVLAASVVTGDPAERDLPTRLRQLLTTESGANDGLALPLVLLALAAVLPHLTYTAALGEIAWQVIGGAAIGIALGALAGIGLKAATHDRDLASGPALIYTLLLAVATLGVARLAGTDGVLAAFLAGLAYNRTIGDRERDTESQVDEAVNRYAVLPLFLLLGAVLPWAEWAALGWGAVGFVAAVLLLRRPPWLLLLKRPLGLTGQDALFAGWFGPIGVSAVFYLAHSVHEGVTEPAFFAAGTLAVTASTIAFGVSAAPGRHAYASAEGRQGEAQEASARG